MNLRTLTINGETIAIVTLYGSNRHPEATQWHARVMVDHFRLPVNYIECPFHLGASHGQMMNEVLRQTVDTPDAPTYYLWLDNDCIPLRCEAIELAYRQVQSKDTIWGHAWQSNHLTGPNGTIPHAYASQACLLFARETYNALDRCSMDHGQPYCDTAEALTYMAKSNGYGVSLLYPSHSVVKDTPLDNGMGYGMGNTYGPLSRPLWHHTSRIPHPRHVEVFTETCKMVMDNAFEGLNPALPYAHA
jgi:hypothetical protein